MVKVRLYQRTDHATTALSLKTSTREKGPSYSQTVTSTKATGSEAKSKGPVSTSTQTDLVMMVTGTMTKKTASVDINGQTDPGTKAVIGKGSSTVRESLLLPMANSPYLSMKENGLTVSKTV